jgi:Leucine-rich repeat (LRR) protein
MFIKKDLRKIPIILADAAATDEATMETSEQTKCQRLADLPLQRRKAEFQGSVKILCQPANAPALLQLKSLSLYDCEIIDLTGIGLCENLVSLNVGRNPVTELPAADFAKLSWLETLCLDDCKLEGRLPVAITCLYNLLELRMANNKITEITDEIRNVRQLTVLGLDRNSLVALPDAVTELLNLQTLLLRSNQLTALPADLPNMISLKLLHVSSNKLSALPDNLAECTSLTHVYANSNAFTQLPVNMERLLPGLLHLNVAHCQIDSLRTDFYRSFGKPNQDGVCTDSSCKVLLTGNPVLKKEDNTDVTMDDVED